MTNNNLVRNYYMVRAMESTDEDFEIFLSNGVVAVGWREVNFSKQADSSVLRQLVNENYYEDSDIAKQVIGKKLNEVERFKGIKKGDYIIVPYYSYILIAEAEGVENYSEDAYEKDLANQHKVAFRYENDSVLTIPRDNLSEGLQRRLRVRGNTVSNLGEFSDEIDLLFTTKSYSYSNVMRDIEREERERLKKGLLDCIQNGRTNLKTGGIGLEQLVCELMCCEGYIAKVLPKNKFSGEADADICAIKEDFFMSKKIFVQVKHHSGNSGIEGINQIIGVLKQDEYKDYEGYFITSAMIDDKVREYAETNSIQVMDGNMLVELITDNIEKLSGTTKRSLGICSVPRMIY